MAFHLVVVIFLKDSPDAIKCVQTEAYHKNVYKEDET